MNRNPVKASIDKIQKNISVKAKQKSQTKVKQKEKKTRLPKESNRFKVRFDINEEGEVGCPAFTVPLMQFSDSEDDDLDFDDDDEDDVANGLANYLPVRNARRMWNTLGTIVLDKNLDIPLKQMAIKKKHEDQIFEKM